MTVVTRGVFWECQSGDVKPTIGVDLNARLIELDTGARFIWNGAAWIPMPSSFAPNSASFVTTGTEAGLTNEKVLGTDIIMTGLAVAKPAFGVAGRIYIETDGSFIVWRDAPGWGGAQKLISARSWNYTGNVSGPKLHIEYSAGGAGPSVMIVD